MSAMCLNLRNKRFLVPKSKKVTYIVIQTYFEKKAIISVLKILTLSRFQLLKMLSDPFDVNTQQANTEYLS